MFINKIIKKIKTNFLKRYSPDIVFRYLPVVDIIKKYKIPASNILEVGSGDFGITKYIGRTVVGIDIIFGDFGDNLLKKVIYDGEIIPFKDNNFDTLISVDSLEHIIYEKRGAMIKEMIRVTDGFIVLIFPEGTLASRQDNNLDKLFIAKKNFRSAFLKEHVENGLPKSDDIINYFLSVSNKKISLVYQKRYLNLGIRNIYMRVSISNSPFFRGAYYLFLLLVPLRNLLNFGRCYREMLVIKVENNK